MAAKVYQLTDTLVTSPNQYLLQEGGDGSAGSLQLEASSGGGVDALLFMSASGDPAFAGPTPSGTWSVEVNITAGVTNTTIYARLQRRDSSGGTTLAVVDATPVAATAGLKTFTFSSPALGTWGSTNRLAVELVFTNNNAHGGASSITFDTDTANAEVLTQLGGSPLIGSAAGTSSASGDLTVDTPPAGPLSGDYTGILGTHDTVPGGTALGAVPSAAGTGLAGSSAGSSTAAGALTLALVLAGSSTGAGSAEGNLTVEASSGVALAGSAAGTSTAVGRLSGEVPLAGSSAGASTASSALGLEIGLVGSSAGSSTAVGGSIVPPTARALQGTSAGTSTAVGLLEAYRPQFWGAPGYVYPGPVEIRYKGIDITAAVIFEGASFKSVANGGAGSAKIRVRDRVHDLSFTTGRELELYINGVREWDGYVSRVRRGYFTVSLPQGPSETVRYFELSGVDRNVLFQKRVLHDKEDGANVQLTTFPADTPDDEVILHYMAQHLDLEGDGISTAGVTEVGSPSQDSEISGDPGWTWGQFMRHISFHTGAIDYIDPDRVLRHVDDDTATAPFAVSDTPGVGQVGYRELEIDYDGTQLRNDALVWGAGQGKDEVVFARVEDDTSITEHLRWQVGRFLPTVWRQATVDRIANSHVYGSPQNKRGGKDDAVGVRYVVFEQGLRVAQKVLVISAVFGFSQVLPIREIEVDFPTPTHPRWTVMASQAIDAPWSTFEFWFPDLEPFPPLPDIDFDLDWDLPETDECLCFDNFDRTVAVHTTAAGFGSEAFAVGGPWNSLDLVRSSQAGNTVAEIDGDHLYVRSGLSFDPQTDGFSAFLPNQSPGEFSGVFRLAFRFKLDGSSPAFHTAAPDLEIWNFFNGDYHFYFYASFSKLASDPDGSQSASGGRGYIEFGAGDAFEIEPLSWATDNWYEIEILVDPAAGTAVLKRDGIIYFSLSSASIPSSPTADLALEWIWQDDLPDPSDPSFDGDHGGIRFDWVQYTCCLIQGEQGPGAAGPVCSDLTEIPDPPNRPTGPTYYTAPSTWIPRTEKVWLDGNLLRRGIDYDDVWAGGWIAIDAAIDTTGKTVHMCYRASSIGVAEL